ncbi:protein-glutamine glutaminase family protein [Sphingobacterium sp.]|uniref:protein-glutamine glutaminase family protein n=1 Tax=Sphingobacterium sp. TaxID=341027 RepID=UPI002FD8F3F1
MKTKILLYLLIAIGLSNSIYAQTYFDLTKEYPAPNNQSYLSDLKTLKTYSYAEVKKAFDEILKSGLEFNYPQGGCQNRAQYMSLLLEKKLNIQHAKIWLFSPADLYAGNQTSLEIADKNQLAPESTIKWLYHVAPCVLTNENGKIDTLVIDPSLDNSQPMKLSSWLKSMKNANVSKYTFLNPKLYFFETTNNNIISGVFYKFEKDPRFATDNYMNLSLEKSLAINDLAIYTLNKYISPLKQSTKESDITKLNDLRKLFGNVSALTKIFGSLESYVGVYASDNIYSRTLLENYPEIMSDAMKFYMDRYILWTKNLTSLK